jgi:hypothetical protein
MSKIRLVTEVPFPGAEVKISFERPVAFMGSCFSVYMAKEMEECGLSVWKDPFGISFNPMSLSENLGFCLENKEISHSELFENEGRFHHFSFHSASSGMNLEETCARMNISIQDFRKVLVSASHLFVTFGSAWVYAHDGNVVNNCHKLPANRFERRILSVDEIVGSWRKTIQALRALNPELHLAFSLSPVRHWKDGADGNSLSKAILRLSIEEIIKTNGNCAYIPSFEFMMDECRDYRFYADDLLHPSSLAISLLWERLSKAYLQPTEEGLFRRFRELKKRESHRTMASGTEAEKSFIEQTQVMKKALLKEVGDKRWTLPS